LEFASGYLIFFALSKLFAPVSVVSYTNIIVSLWTSSLLWSCLPSYVSPIKPPRTKPNLSYARHWASAAKKMRTAIFRVMGQRVVITPYRRFGTTYRFHFQGSRIRGGSLNYRAVRLGGEVTLHRVQRFERLLGFLIPEHGTNRMSRNVGKELPVQAALQPQKRSVPVMVFCLKDSVRTSQ